MINSLVLTCSLQIKDEEKIKLSPDLLIVGVFFIAKANQELFGLITELGVERVLWGTDWIAGPVEIYMAELEPELLSADVWEVLRANTAPYIEN